MHTQALHSQDEGLGQSHLVALVTLLFPPVTWSNQSGSLSRYWVVVWPAMGQHSLECSSVTSELS